MQGRAARMRPRETATQRHALDRIAPLQAPCSGCISHLAHLPLLPACKDIDTPVRVDGEDDDDGSRMCMCRSPRLLFLSLRNSTAAFCGHVSWAPSLVIAVYE